MNNSAANQGSQQTSKTSESTPSTGLPGNYNLKNVPTPSSLSGPSHESMKDMKDGKIEKLLLQFVSEQLAYAHLSAQIDDPTRQSVETMSVAFKDTARKIINAVRRVERENPPTSFWNVGEGSSGSR